MSTAVWVDPLGPVVIPHAERERLGLHDRGALELVSTPEGGLLERRRQATVTSGDDGIPMVTLAVLAAELAGLQSTHRLPTV